MKKMKRILKLIANMLAIATFALMIPSCNEDKNIISPYSTEIGSIKVNPTVLYLEIDSSQILTVTLSPSDAAKETVVWSSYNKDIAKVSPTGDLAAVVKGMSIGTTTVSAVTSNNRRTMCEVTVSKSVQLVAITIVPSDSLYLETGKKQQLVATQGPADATNYYPVWTSSNPDVATVEDGLVTAENAGTAIVTVTSDNISESVRVTVTDPLSDVEADKLLSQ
jgi:uncharacterized protein YjdB